MNRPYHEGEVVWVYDCEGCRIWQVLEQVTGPKTFHWSYEPSEECTVLRETRRRAVADERGMRTKERTSGQFL